MNGFFSKGRQIFVYSLSALLAVAIIVKYSLLAITPAPEPVVPKSTVERGRIVDRHGKPLAVSTNFYHFVVTPSVVHDVNLFAEKLSPLLMMPSEEIKKTLEDSRSKSFIYLKKKISEEDKNAIWKNVNENGFLAAVRFDRIPGRIYPENSLASQLIGYMGDDGVGLSGMEYVMQDVLSPKPAEHSMSTVHGDTVFLSIDMVLQRSLEKIAYEAMNETGAETLRLIAADCTTGEILSYISFPAANLNDYRNASSTSKTDLLSVLPYEPGSVFKIFTVASYLDSKSIAADDSFFCDGVYQKRTNLGERIRITCLEHHGWVNAKTSLKYSCNDALAQMSENIETDLFLDYIHKFGFGEKCGVQVPTETRGIIKNPDDKFWSGRTKATMSIGQELSVSALQIVQAATAIANKGSKVKLSLVHKIVDAEGTEKYKYEPEVSEKIIKGEIADYILSCMETTVKSGTGSKAALGDILIGVKTGTAQMADPVKGGYSATDFLSNCLAIFPINNPKIILYIALEKAKGETYAGRIVAPVIAKAADEIIDHLGITRDSATSVRHDGIIHVPDNLPPSMKRYVPDFTGRPKRDLIELLGDEKINYIIKGEGWVVSQNPPPLTPITENMTIELFLE